MGNETEQGLTTVLSKLTWGPEELMLAVVFGTLRNWSYLITKLQNKNILVQDQNLALS